MNTPKNRRNFLVQGAVGTAGLFAVGIARGQEDHVQPVSAQMGEHSDHTAGPQNVEFPRHHPGWVVHR